MFLVTFSSLHMLVAMWGSEDVNYIGECQTPRVYTLPLL